MEDYHFYPVIDKNLILPVLSFYKPFCLGSGEQIEMSDYVEFPDQLATALLQEISVYPLTRCEAMRCETEWIGGSGVSQPKPCAYIQLFVYTLP